MCCCISWTQQAELSPGLIRRLYWLDTAQKVGAAVGVTSFFSSFIVVGATGSRDAFLSLFLGGPTLGVAALSASFVRAWQRDVHHVYQETPEMQFYLEDIFEAFQSYCCPSLWAYLRL